MSTKEDDRQGDVRVSADEAKRIVAEHLAAQLAAQVAASAKVELGVGRFYGAPEEPVWLVTPSLSAGTRVGGDRVVAVCPRTGRVLGDAVIGE